MTFVQSDPLLSAGPSWSLDPALAHTAVFPDGYPNQPTFTTCVSIILWCRLNTYNVQCMYIHVHGVVMFFTCLHVLFIP